MTAVPGDFTPRFRPRIAETHTVGPRLVIEDRRPVERNSVRRESWLDLPVQCSRTEGRALSWLVVREAKGDAQHTFTGSADDLDDLYSALKRLGVHQLFTLRPVPFDADEDRS
jgi:hypothetical protein